MEKYMAVRFEGKSGVGQFIVGVANEALPLTTNV
jgi:hypothetical protein